MFDLQELLKHGANTEATLHQAPVTRDSRVQDHISHGATAEAILHDGITALIAASENGHFDVVQVNHMLF